MAPARSRSGYHPGDWYDYQDDERLAGLRTLARPSATGVLPLFVRAGAILPGARPMSSTQNWDKGTLLVDVYVGANGTFELVEDDGITEQWTKGAVERTKLSYSDEELELSLAASGTYAGAPTERAYEIRYHGLAEPPDMMVDGKPIARLPRS